MKCFQWAKFNNHGEQSEECEEDTAWIQVMGCHPLGVQEDVALISEIKTDGAGLTVNEEVASTFWNMFYTVILCIQV